MASTPRSTIEDSYASSMRCAICGAEALHVGHAGKLPDYVTCRSCTSAFLVEDGGERIFYGQIAPGFPETEAFALRQWAFPEAIEKLARPERPTLPEIEPEPILPSEPADEAPDLSSEVDDSAFASEFGFLEELAQTGPASEPPAESPKGLVDSDEPHAADALTPPPWAKIEPDQEEITPTAAEEESLPSDELTEDELPANGEPAPGDAAMPPPPDRDSLPVWETFKEAASEPELPEVTAPTLETGVSAPDGLDSFKFEDDAIPGEPVELGQMDDPLGLASAFEALTLDSSPPTAPEESVMESVPGEDEPGDAWTEPASPMQEAETQDDWLAGMTDIPSDEAPTSLESDSPSIDMTPTEEVEAEDDWLSGMTAIPGEDDATTIESSASPATDMPPSGDFAVEDDWLASMAASPAEDDPTTIESSGSRPTQAEPAGEDVDWLSAMAETPLEDAPREIDRAPGAPVEPTPAVDWLSEIQDDAVEGAEPTAVEPSWAPPADEAIPAGEAAADEDWLAALSGSTNDEGEAQEAEIDWLASISDTAAGGDEPMHTVTNWLSSRADTADDEAGSEDKPDSEIDWLGTSAESSTGEGEEAAPDAFAALRSAEPEPADMDASTDEDDEDDSYDPFDFNQRIASLKAEAKKEQTQEPEEDDFLSGLRRSAAIPLESEPLENTPLASVNLDSQPFVKPDDETGEDEATDPLAMAARMGAIAAAADEASIPEWMEDAEGDAEPRPTVGAFKLRDTDPPIGHRHRVVLRGDRVVFPSGDCAHCGRTPVKGRLAVYGTLPNGQKVGQRKVTSFNVPLCGECRARAALLTEEASNARLQAHLISAIIGMILVVLSLVIGIIDPRALALPDLMILAILLIVGYAGPVTFLLNRVGNYPPPPDAVYVRTTLIVPGETQGLETAFEWRNQEYAQRFFDANQAYTIGKMSSVKDRLASPKG